MRPQTRFEIFRWTYYVLFWLIGMGISVIVIETAGVPAVVWLLYDIPYELPTWDRAGRLTVFVIFFSLFAGTVTWFAEKR